MMHATFLMLVAGLASPSHAAWGWLRACATGLDRPIALVRHEYEVRVDGVTVSGEDVYPTWLVLRNLGLDEAALAGLRGKKVLSIGEGFSGLVPHLRERGVAARGLDLWYGHREFPANYIGNRMREYVARNKRHLIVGEGKFIPAHRRTYDLVVSHMLVNNIDFFEALYILNEARRVTKPGGEIRFFGYPRYQITKLEQILKDVFRDTIAFRLEEKPFSQGDDRGSLSRTDSLLTVIVR